MAPAIDDEYPEVEEVTRVRKNPRTDLLAFEEKKFYEEKLYFADPNDLIPDRVPGLGYIDDAIKVELVRRELAPEIDAYDDFCAFRSAEEEKRRSAGEDSSVSREDWLKSKREELQRDLHKKRSWFKPFSRGK